MNQWLIPGYGFYCESGTRQFMVAGYGFVLDAGVTSTNIVMNII